MDSKELCETIIKEIEKAKSRGSTSIQCGELIEYLKDIDHAKKELSAGDLAFYNATNQYTLEMSKTTVAFGQGAMKSLFLLNAGAAVVMLTFVTHLAKDARMIGFVDSIWWFAVGVLSAASVAVFAYLSQLFQCYDKPYLKRLGKFFHFACIFVGGASLWLFWEGLESALGAFEIFRPYAIVD